MCPAPRLWRLIASPITIRACSQPPCHLYRTALPGGAGRHTCAASGDPTGPLPAASALGLAVPAFDGECWLWAPCSGALQGSPAGGCHAGGLCGVTAPVRVLLAGMRSTPGVPVVGRRVSLQRGPGRHLRVARCRRGGAAAGRPGGGGCRSARGTLQGLQPVRHIPLVLGRCRAPARAAAQGKRGHALPPPSPAPANTGWVACGAPSVSEGAAGASSTCILECGGKD